MLTILTCRDLPRMRAFYQDVFAWMVEVDTPNYVELQVDSTSFLGLMEASLTQTFIGERRISMDPGAVRPVELYLRVEDPQLLIARMLAAGAELTSPLQMRSWGEEAAYLLDPEGTLLAVAARAKSSPLE